MSKNPRKAGNNVVSMPASVRENRKPARDLAAGTAASSALDACGPDDPRMQEALRLMEAFLAIEDQQGRAALITLAERLVSYDWVRKVQQR
jgi:hypothetical protein